MSLRSVSAKDLLLSHPLWVNPRFETGLSKDELADLWADLKSRGQLIALKVQKIKTKDGFANLVLDGQRRVMSAIQAGEKGHMFDVDDLHEDVLELTAESSADLLLDTLAIVSHRASLGSHELVENAKILRDAGKSVNAIGKAIGKDGSWVSRMLTATDAAVPSVVKTWKEGHLTDELFREISQVDKGEQTSLAKKVVETREEKNDPSAARALVREVAAEAKMKREEGPSKGGKAKPGPKSKSGKVASSKKDGPTPPPKALVEELWKLGQGRPVMDPYVKGLIEGAGYALGHLETTDFGKSWDRFIARLETSFIKAVEKPTKDKAKPKKAKVPKKDKPAKSAKGQGKAPKKATSNGAVKVIPDAAPPETDYDQTPQPEAAN